MAQVPPVRAASCPPATRAEFEQTWTPQSPTKLFAPYDTALLKPRAWQRKPRSSSTADGRARTIWKRFTPLVELDCDQISSTSCQPRSVARWPAKVVKKIRLDPDENHEGSDEFLPTLWERDSEILPHKESRDRDSLLFKTANGWSTMETPLGTNIVVPGTYRFEAGSEAEYRAQEGIRHSSRQRLLPSSPTVLTQTQCETTDLNASYQRLENNDNNIFAVIGNSSVEENESPAIATNHSALEDIIGVRVVSNVRVMAVTEPDICKMQESDEFQPCYESLPHTCDASLLIHSEVGASLNGLATPLYKISSQSSLEGEGPGSRLGDVHLFTMSGDAMNRLGTNSTPCPKSPDHSIAETSSYPDQQALIPIEANDNQNLTKLELARPEITINEDKDMLLDFLKRVNANKAARRTARISPISCRSDSDVLQLTLASPRKVLEDIDPNATSLQESDTLPESYLQTSPPKHTGKAYTTDESSAHSHHAQLPENNGPVRRSTRICAANPNHEPEAKHTPSIVTIRRPDNQDCVILQRSEKQELASQTRANTRRNKGGALPVRPTLLKLSNCLSFSPEEARQYGRETMKQERERNLKIQWAPEEDLIQYCHDNAIEVPNQNNHLADMIHMEQHPYSSRPITRKIAGLTSNSSSPRKLATVVDTFPKATTEFLIVSDGKHTPFLEDTLHSESVSKPISVLEYQTALQIPKPQRLRQIPTPAKPRLKHHSVNALERNDKQQEEESLEAQAPTTMKSNVSSIQELPIKKRSEVVHRRRIFTGCSAQSLAGLSQEDLSAKLTTPSGAKRKPIGPSKRSARAMR